MCYYSEQLKRINLKSEFPAQVKLSDGEGNKTNFLSLNKESAKVLVKWLTANFLKETKSKRKEKILREFYNYVYDEHDCVLREEQIHLFLDK